MISISVRNAPSGTFVSGLRNTTYRPAARLAPWLLAAVKPGFTAVLDEDNVRELRLYDGGGRILRRIVDDHVLHRDATRSARGRFEVAPDEFLRVEGDGHD